MIGSIAKMIWRVLGEVYVEFSLESSIHGIKYTTQSKSTVSRFFWSLLIILSILAGGHLMVLFYERHQSASMSTVIITNQFPTWKLSLPAVTLCHGNIAVRDKVLHYLTSQKRIYMPRGITRSDFEESVKYLREAIRPTNHFPDELDKLQQILSANRLSLSELFENISPNCSDFLKICEFEGETFSCEDSMEPILTPYGMCCSFNYENPLDGTRRIKKRHGSGYFGPHFVLSFLTKTSSSYDRVSSIIHGDGFKVIIHDPYTYPGLSSVGFVVPSGHETVARLYGSRVTSSKDILELPDNTRNCSFSPSSSSSSSAATFPYRSENCYIQCRVSVVHKLCGCIVFYAADFYVGEQICNLTHVPCLARTTLQMHLLISKDLRCDCLPDCEETTYKAAVTSLPLSATRYHPARFYRTAERYPNISILHVTLASQSAILQRRELILPIITLASSLGGIYSLLLGCSFISLIEIFYFFCFHFFYKLQFKFRSQEFTI